MNILQDVKNYLPIQNIENIDERIMQYYRYGYTNCKFIAMCVFNDVVADKKLVKAYCESLL